MIQRMHWPPLAAAVSGASSRLSHAEAMGRYLETLQWTHFVTLTARGRVSDAALRAKFEHEFIRDLTRAAQRAVSYFFAVEYAGGPDVSPHVHGLLAETERLTVDRIGAAWRHGLTCVRVYDRTKGAALYSAKGLLLDEDSYDFSRRPPRPRHDAAAVAARAMLDGHRRGHGAE